PVVVHFEGLSDGDIGLRIGAGAGAITTVLKGQALAARNETYQAYNSNISASSRLASGASAGTAPDSVLFVRFDAKPAVGTITVPPFTVTTSRGSVRLEGNTGVSLEIVGPKGFQYYVAVSPANLQITALDMPAVPTLGTTGSITGRVSFQAAGLSMSPGS